MKPRKPTQQELEDIFRTPYPDSSEVTKSDHGNNYGSTRHEHIDINRSLQDRTTGPTIGE